MSTGSSLLLTKLARTVLSWSLCLQVARLRQWQQQMPPLKRPPLAATTAAAPQLQPPLKRLLPANTQLLPQEFGSNLDIKILDSSAAMAWFIPAAGSSGSNAASRRQQQMAAMAGGAATPAELRQVFAAEAMQDDLGWGGDGRASGTEEEGLDIDIDSDDEKRGKGKKVSSTVRHIGCFCLQYEQYLPA